MIPEPGMSCSVCHLHLMLFYVEMYERNKIMILTRHATLSEADRADRISRNVTAT